ncbi:MAG: c-type cytochrome [Gammaproteobacteria bacterium]|nr:c-type cytochrome [Gammaproteobacteria bacterium]
MRFHRLGKTLLLLFIGLLGVQAWAKERDSREVVDRELHKPLVRGGIVFKHYCARCHGEAGEGENRTAKLYVGLNMAIKPQSKDAFFKIVSKGGEAVGRSPFMPPWEEELSKEQLSDVLAYLMVVGERVSRGEAVYKTNCTLCHGVDGDGKGRASKLYNPPPADLTRSDKNDDYKTSIITLGGAAMARSPFMPVWGEQLSKQEIADVVAYLRTIVTKAAAK